jgi:hypothetical protein
MSTIHMAMSRRVTFMQTNQRLNLDRWITGNISKTLLIAKKKSVRPNVDPQNLLVTELSQIMEIVFTHVLHQASQNSMKN